MSMTVCCIILVVVLLVIVAINLNPKEKERKTPSDLHIKKQFLTKHEQDFYKKLETIINGRSKIMCQVRLVDVVAINPKYKLGKLGLAYFRRISQWHCDFVLIDDNFNIRSVIELDDNSHNRADRIKRDNYFNLVLNQAGIRLIRIKKINELNNDLINSILI